MRYLILFTLQLAMTVSSYTQKYDYWWGFTSNPLLTPGYEGTWLNFNDKQLTLTECALPITLDQVNVTMSDAEGKLQFYGNGCRLVNAQDQLIENGDSLNFDQNIWNLLGGDCAHGYSGTQNELVIHNGGSRYTLFHRRANMVPWFNIDGLYATEIDMAANEGKGRVNYKDKLVFKGAKPLMVAYFHAVKHANGKDWWLMNMADFENLHYVLLYDSSGVHLHHELKIGPLSSPNTSAGGQGKFSPDGTKWAIGNNTEGISLYDFDRSTGMLSNWRHIDTLVRKATFTGLEFSANSRFLYFSNLDSLYQIDTEATDLEGEIELIGTWDFTSDPFQTSFCQMQRGPDCKIYISSVSSTRTIHVINKPDEKGEACEFAQHGLRLFYSTGTISMPNFPNYRLDVAPVCDPDIVTATMQAYYFPQDRHINVYPNPAQDQTHILALHAGKVTIHNSSGQEWWHQAVDRESTTTIDISTWPQGIYMVRFDDGRGGSEVRKLVKI